jgi:hypothetical protein
MNADQRPQAYGVFKPVGHVIVALPSENARDDAVAGLLRAGFMAADIHAYSPSEMIAQVDDELAHASGLAGIGQELNLVKAHRELALQGSNFLVVRARDAHEADQIADVALQCHASRAQRYGSFVIEELIPVGGSEKQVAESTDRGLDAQTTSGHERAASR